MSEDAWQILGIATVVVLALVGAIYGWVRYEQRRLAKNLHGLRTIVQRIILTLTAKGIMVRRGEDEE